MKQHNVKENQNQDFAKKSAHSPQHQQKQVVQPKPMDQQNDYYGKVASMEGRSTSSKEKDDTKGTKWSEVKAKDRDSETTCFEKSR